VQHWATLAAEGRVDELFESIMVLHYDPCYERSTRRNYAGLAEGGRLALDSLEGEGFVKAVADLVASARGY
jgi:tRNA 2-selenouridine synthase